MHPQFSRSNLRADPLPHGFANQGRAVPRGPCCPMALDNWNGDLHLHGWHVCSTGQKCLWVLLSLLYERKRRVWKRWKRSGSTAPNTVARRKHRRQMLWGRVLGWKCKHGSAPLLFWLLLLWYVGSALRNALFHHQCDGAHPPFGQISQVKPVATCYNLSTEYMHTSVCFSKVKIPSKESVMQEIF